MKLLGDKNAVIVYDCFILAHKKKWNDLFKVATGSTPCFSPVSGLTVGMEHLYEQKSAKNPIDHRLLKKMGKNHHRPVIAE